MDDSPLGPSELRIEAEQFAVFVGDALENSQGVLWPEQAFTIASFVEVLVAVLNFDFEAALTDLRLFKAAAALGVGSRVASFLALTYISAVNQFQKRFEPGLGALNLQQLLPLLIYFIYRSFKQNSTTVITNASEYLLQVDQQTGMVNWCVEADVTEVAGASLHPRLARVTIGVFVHDAHAGVVHRVEVRGEGHLVVDLS